VILVDDVVTTGATADRCAGACLRAGALRVVLAAACRA
jgi:predicted amidophosphoribosyltransferase